MPISEYSDPKDFEDNLRVARVLVKYFPDLKIEIRPHSYEEGIKNPEYVIIENGIRYNADRKSIEKVNGITSGFVKGKEQTCRIIVIDFDKHLSTHAFPAKDAGGKTANRHADFTSGLMPSCYVIYRNRAIRIPAEVFIEGDIKGNKHRVYDILKKLRE